MNYTEGFIVLFSLLILVIYAGQMIILSSGWRKLNRTGRIKDPVFNPRVSVVVAARDEINHIRDLLEGLRNLDYPAELFEVILVDDHSSDGTYEMTGQYIRKEGLKHFRVISLAAEGSRISIN